MIWIVAAKRDLTYILSRDYNLFLIIRPIICHGVVRHWDFISLYWKFFTIVFFFFFFFFFYYTLTLSEVGVCAGAAAQAGEVRKHSANDDKCGDLGWFCVPLVTETYGAWGPEAKACFSQLASRLSIRLQKPKSVILHERLKHMSRSLCCYGHIK